MKNLKFDFVPMGRNSNSRKRSPITGMTLTVYEKHCAITNEVLDALGNPDAIGISYQPDFSAFLVFPDPNGIPVSMTRSRNQFSLLEIKDTIKSLTKYDDKTCFVRLVDGRKYGKYVLFSTENIIKVARK